MTCSPEFYSSPQYQKYIDHIHSDYWYDLKERRLRERANFRCERCGNTEAEAGATLELHHARPYRECLFRETVEDVEVLCWRCHSAHSGTTRDRGRYSEPSVPDDQWDQFLDG